MENHLIRKLYNQLGKILSKGDDIFIQEGPIVLQKACANPELLQHITLKPATESYTRKKVISDDGKHVIRAMEWPAGFYLMPHEHHGRPCFEFLISGQLVVSDMLPRENGNGEFTLELLQTHVLRPGQYAIVDPRVTQIHSVFSPVKSISLHVYPNDNFNSIGYVKNGSDLYTRKEFQLRDD